MYGTLLAATDRYMAELLYLCTNLPSFLLPGFFTPNIMRTTILMLLACASLSLHAQSPTAVFDTWFLEERFLIADKDENALLNRAELQTYSREFGYYLAENHFALSDLNHDGQLSFNEISKRAQTEFAYRQAMERKEVRALEAQYPMLSLSAETALRNNPSLAEKLFGNYTFLRENAPEVAKLYNDPAWTASHKTAMVALHHNLRWMVANPADARSLYRDRTVTDAIPELLGWRNAHKDLLRRYPQVDKIEGMIFVR